MSDPTNEPCNIDPEDLSDVLLKIKRSFDLTYEPDTFEKANTFGDICDIMIPRKGRRKTMAAERL